MTALQERAGWLAANGQIAQAMALLEKAIADGDGAAAFLLANWRFEGTLVRRDFALARQLFGLAVERGCDEAYEPFMALLANGVGGKSRDWQHAVQMLRERSARCERASQQARLIEAMALNSEGEPVGDYRPTFLSSDPLIVAFENFLSGEECDEVIAMASASFAPSLVIHPQSGQLVRDNIRTSSTTSFPLLRETPFMHALNRRIAVASRSGWEQGEPTQILCYERGQEYKLHSDALQGENQRIQTFLVYLTDDFDGGETYFPHGELSLRLPKGHAICFSNVTDDMQPSRNARHAGKPVTRGQKIVLSKWIRMRPLDLTGPAGKPF